MASCTIGGCDAPAVARGWCGRHWQRWKSHGDPTYIKTLRGLPVEERFWRQVNKNGPVSQQRPDLGQCWMWIGMVVKTYGCFNVSASKRALAHRYAYECTVGQIPAGLEIDHLCRIRLCVNPEHLEAVTRAENNARSQNVGVTNAAKTHCPQGHPYDEQNTILSKRGNGKVSRVCRTCRRAVQRRYVAGR